jgi:hypothetical protein
VEALRRFRPLDLVPPDILDWKRRICLDLQLTIRKSCASACLQPIPLMHALPWCPVESRNRSVGSPKSPVGHPNRPVELPNRLFGLPNHRLGRPNRPFGLPNHRLGLPNRRFGCPNRRFGPPNRRFGLPNRPFGLRSRPFGPPDAGGLPARSRAERHRAL